MARKRVPRHAWPMLMLLAALAVVSRIVSALIQGHMTDVMPISIRYTVAALEEILLYGLPAIVCLLLPHSLRTQRERKKRRLGTGGWLAVMLTAVFHQLAVVCLVVVLMPFFQRLGLTHTGLPLPGAAPEILVAALAVTLVPAICEEGLFRGALLPALLREFSDGSAIALTSLYFALMHRSLPLFPSQLAAGLVMTLLCYQTGRLLPAIVYHCVYNGVAFTISCVPVLAGGLSFLMEAPAFALSLCAVFGLLSLWPGYRALAPLRRWTRREAGLIARGLALLLFCILAQPYLPL